MKTKALFIIDVQKGFLNKLTKDLPIKIAHFLEEKKEVFDYIFFFKFINKQNSNWTNLLNWYGMFNPPDTDIAKELKKYTTNDNVFSKRACFSVFKAENFINSIDQFLKGKFILRLEDSDGVCDHNPEAGSETVTCSSDGKLKTNIRDSADVLPDLMKLRIRDYTVLSSGNELTGIIAQEVQPIFPEMVSEGPEGYLMVSQPNTWELVKAIQELQTEFESLKREGIEMRDKATGEVYCVAITNGEWDKVKGSCSQ